jgi:hypothetical protein
MNLTSCLRIFFDQYLPKTKGVSPNTIQAYRQAFGLFVPFAAMSLQREAKSLQIEHLTTQLILDFLDHLEVECKTGTGRKC